MVADLPISSNLVDLNENHRGLAEVIHARCCNRAPGFEIVRKLEPELIPEPGAQRKLYLLRQNSRVRPLANLEAKNVFPLVLRHRNELDVQTFFKHLLVKPGHHVRRRYELIADQGHSRLGPVYYHGEVRNSEVNFLRRVEWAELILDRHLVDLKRRPLIILTKIQHEVGIVAANLHRVRIRKKPPECSLALFFGLHIFRP